MTSGFGNYNLSSIRDKYLAEVDETEKLEILPKRVGGSQVQELNLDPELIIRLSSGIAVNSSPFEDILIKNHISWSP